MNCEELLKKHPDLLIEDLEECHVYKVTDNGTVLEQWEKDENDVWVDKTQEVQEEHISIVSLKRQIAELEKRLRYVK